MARRHVVLPVIAGLALLTGCGAKPAEPLRLVSAAAPAKDQGAQGMWVTAPPRVDIPADVAVRAEDIPGFGPALTDQDGRTLYLFTLDSTEPSRSTCEGECAETWPPLLATGEVTTDGVDPDLVGEVSRVDGARQVTVGGWPVHTFTGDTAPGQTTGHGASGVWFVIEPAGCKSTRAPDGSTSY